jgi:hypothetical protein
MLVGYLMGHRSKNGLPWWTSVVVAVVYIGMTSFPAMRFRDPYLDILVRGLLPMTSATFLAGKS